MATNRRKYPLRKVLKRVQLDLEMIEVFGFVGAAEMLECGHVIQTPQDIMGHTYAERRRCGKCYRNKPQDFDPSTISP